MRKEKSGRHGGNLLTFWRVSVDDERSVIRGRNYVGSIRWKRLLSQGVPIKLYHSTLWSDHCLGRGERKRKRKRRGVHTLRELKNGAICQGWIDCLFSVEHSKNLVSIRQERRGKSGKDRTHSVSHLLLQFSALAKLPLVCSMSNKRSGRVITQLLIAYEPHWLWWWSRNLCYDLRVSERQNARNAQK